MQDKIDFKPCGRFWKIRFKPTANILRAIFKYVLQVLLIQCVQMCLPLNKEQTLEWWPAVCFCREQC